MIFNLKYKIQHLTFQVQFQIQIRFQTPKIAFEFSVVISAISAVERS